MSMLKIKITVNERAAIVSGKNVFGDVEIEIDLEKLTPEERLHIVDRNKNLCRSCYSTPCIEAYPVIFEPTEGNAVLIVKTMSSVVAKRGAEKAAELEQKTLEWLSKPDDQKIYMDTFRTATSARVIGDKEINSNDPRVRDEQRRLGEIMSQRMAAEKEKIAATRENLEKQEAEKKEKEIEIDKGKVNQLSEVVTLYGSKTQKEKWAAGLMARKEALDLLWAETFKTPLDGTDFVARDNKTYILMGYITDTNEDNYTYTQITTLSDPQFEAFQRIKKIFGDAAVYDLAREVYASEETDEKQSVVYCEVSKTVGLYTLECAITLE